MARPKNDSNDNRDQIVRARFSAAEKRMLLAAASAAAMTPSDFVRVRTIGGAPATRKATPDRTVFIKGLAELNKVGSNVNQIARVLNASRKEGIPIDVSPLALDAALHGIATLTTHLLKALNYDDGDTR